MKLLSNALFNASQSNPPNELLLECSLDLLETVLRYSKNRAEIENSRIIPKFCLLRGWAHQRGDADRTAEISQRLMVWSNERRFVKEFCKMAKKAVIFAKNKVICRIGTRGVSSPKLTKFGTIFGNAIIWPIFSTWNTVPGFPFPRLF